MPGTRPQPGAGQPRRAVILTALPVEYEAVLAHLHDPQEAPHPQGTIYEKGTFLSPSGNWEILLAEIDPGNPSAAFEAERAISFFKPEVALFVGVAGGLKDVALGDVVAATLAHGYESGKAANEFLPRDDPFRSTFRLRERAKAEGKRDNWRGRIKAAAFASPPQVLVKPIGAGEKVVASKRSAIYKFLRATYSDAVAVEMEGVGFLRASYANPGVEALVIRGISDLISQKNLPDEHERQDTASRHAAAFAFEVLAKFEIPAEREKPRPGIIWNVPHPRNRNFTGRGQLLKDLRESLTKGQTTALTQAALHGLGGVGKTQLALEYAYRFAPESDLVWWVRSEDPVTLAAEYAGLAVKLGLPEAGAAEQEMAVAAVRQCLGQRGKWLLIFDNAGEPRDLKGFIPRGGGGQVLITSRNPAWRGVARPLDVKVWDRPESVAFLLKRTGREEAAGEGEKAAAGQLAEELGDLPLALEQAGAYIEACGCSIAQYLDLFRDRRQEVLKRGQPSQDYPDTVATTWDLSFQKVKEASPAAADLLNLCAFLAPDDIPKELLVEGAEDLPKSMAAAVQDPVAFNDALAVLRRYSLMEVADDALAVHRLVQAVVRDRLNEGGKKHWAGAAVEMVNEVFPRGIVAKVETWPWCARLLPHGQACAAHAQELKAALPATASLFNAIGAYLNIRAEYEAAKQALEGALAIGEAIYKPDNPKIATYANNLGYMLQTLGDLEGARAHYERALAIMEKVHGPNHPQVAIDVNNLGSVLRALGDLAGARVHYERALAIDEAAYGPDHPEVAIDVSNLGGVLRDLEDLEGAKAHYERALAIMEKVHGPNHPHVATAVNNLGSVLLALGDLPGAKACFERALAMGKETFGPNHPKVALRLNNLGNVLRDLGDLSGARVHFERALAIRRQFLGEDHPKTKLVRDKLASLGLPLDE